MRSAYLKFKDFLKDTLVNYNLVAFKHPFIILGVVTLITITTGILASKLPVKTDFFCLLYTSPSPRD